MKQQGLLKGSAILMVAMLVSKLTGAIFKIPLTNMLGGTGMGYFSSAYELFLPVYSALASGLPTAFVRLVAENSARGRYADIRKLRKISIAAFLVLGIIGTAAIILLSKPFSMYIAQNPNCIYSIYMLAPSMIFCCLASIERGYYEGMRNMYPTAISQIVEGIVKTVFGLCLAYFVLKTGIHDYETKRTVIGISVSTYDEAYRLILPYAAAAAMIGITISEAAGFLVIFIKNRLFGDGISKEMINNAPKPKRAKALIKELLAISIPIAVGATVLSLSSFIDLATIIRGLKSAIKTNPEYFYKKFELALNNGTNIEELPNFIYGAYMGLTSTIIGFVPIVAAMLGKSTLPNLTAVFVSGDKRKIKSNIEDIMRAGLIFSFPAGLGICVMSEPILNLLYPMRPNEVMVTVTSMSVLGISAIFVSLSLPLCSMLQAVGKEKMVVLVMIFGESVKLAGNILLIKIPEINVFGAAISELVSSLIIIVIEMVILLKTVKVGLRFKRIFFFPAICSLSCCFVAVLSFNMLKSLLSQSKNLIISVTFSVICYIILLLITKTVRIGEIKRKN